MKFIFQDGVKFLDNQYLLEQAKEYWNFRNSGKPEEFWTKIEIIHESEGYSEDPKELCPVGTVEWTVAWYSKVWGKKPSPRNIPPELYHYFPGMICKAPAGSSRFLLTENILHQGSGIWADSVDQNIWMIKSAETIKSGMNGRYSGMDEVGAILDLYLPEEQILTSWIPEILSEWRCFIYQGMLVDAKCYSWSDTPFSWIPDYDTIRRMIQEFGNAPVAYTLDVGVCKTYRKDPITFPVEVHDFFSCGLYGFDELSKFPFMLYRWFREYTI